MARCNSAPRSSSIHSEIMEICLSANLFGAQQPVFINTNGNDLPHIRIKCGGCSYDISRGTCLCFLDPQFYDLHTWNRTKYAISIK